MDTVSVEARPLPGPTDAAPILETLRQINSLAFGLAQETNQGVQPLAALDAENVRLTHALADQQSQMRALSARLNEIEENTRRRLSHDLHDRAGQSLTAMGLYLTQVRTKLVATGQTDLLEWVDRCFQQLADMTQQVRDVMVELRPPVLDDLGLFAALGWYGAHFAEQTNLAVQVQGTELPVRLPLIVETALFRIAQEALNNIVKHGQAQHVYVRFERLAQGARLTIGDDGQGFSPQRPRGLSERPRWGLISMRERAETVGATMRISSAAGRGTRVIVEVLY